MSGGPERVKSIAGTVVVRSPSLSVLKSPVGFTSSCRTEQSSKWARARCLCCLPDVMHGVVGNESRGPC